ncbi:hypothetical protein A5677_13700 [Mycobacterium malmoense]|uniref:Uncharacterized protein n=1 Tax=Mycobacterium malmoense TaxID=1780 RepID=A0A1B9DCV5_MYCMA|nr:hypothetical protein A5677_13700 [Mycobacterium malmoense]
MKVDIAQAARDMLPDPATGLPKRDLICKVAESTHYQGPALEFGIQYGVEQRMLRRGDGNMIFGISTGD